MNPIIQGFQSLFLITQGYASGAAPPPPGPVTDRALLWVEPARALLWVEPARQTVWTATK